jgi:hypothetical protein
MIKETAPHFEPKGYQINNLNVGISSLLTGLMPYPRKALNRLEDLNKELGTDLSLELWPPRFTLLPKDGQKIAGVHAPPFWDSREASRAIFEEKPGFKRSLFLGAVAIRMGTETGPLSLFYRGQEVAAKLGAYYNVHPNVLNQMALRKEKGQAVPSFYAQHPILLENIGHSAHAPLCWDPPTIRDFTKEHQIGTTLDTSHALETAKVLGTPPGDYLRQLWELGPEVIHFSNYDRRNSNEHCPVDHGDSGPLAELVQGARPKRTVVIFEIHPRYSREPSSLEEVIGQTIDFLVKNSRSIDSPPKKTVFSEEAWQSPPTASEPFRVDNRSAKPVALSGSEV